MATAFSSSSGGPPTTLAPLAQPPFLSQHSQPHGNLEPTRVSCSPSARSTTVPVPGVSSASSSGVNPDLYVTPEWLASLLKRSSCSTSSVNSLSGGGVNSLGNESHLLQDAYRTSNIPFKVFDIRPLQFFTASRIKGAIHLQLPNLILRRLRRGPVRLSSLMSDSDSRQELERHSECNTITIVLYEEGPMVHLLVKNFSELGFHTKVLKGSFVNFEKHYPELCESQPQSNGQQSSDSHLVADLTLTRGGGESQAGEDSNPFSRSANEGSMRPLPPLCNLRISCSQPVTPANLRDFRAFNLAPELAQLESPNNTTAKDIPSHNGETGSVTSPFKSDILASNAALIPPPSLLHQTNNGLSQTEQLLSSTANTLLPTSPGASVGGDSKSSGGAGELPPLSSGLLTLKSKSVDLLRDSNLLSVQCVETKQNISSSLNNSSTCLRHQHCSKLQHHTKCSHSHHHHRSSSSSSSSRNPLLLSTKRAGSLTQILPNLYLGDQVDSRDADSLKKHGIRAIVNVTPDLPNHFEKCSEGASCCICESISRSKSTPSKPTPTSSSNKTEERCTRQVNSGKHGEPEIRSTETTAPSISSSSSSSQEQQRTAGNSEQQQQSGLSAFEELIGEIKYLKVPIDDQFSSDIMLHFPRAISFIDEAISSGCSVLVHCLAGVSRSVTIMIAYLISSKRMRLTEAIEHVRRRRPNISPNFNFMGQLLEFEKQQHFSSNSSSPNSHSKTASLSSHSSPLALSPVTLTAQPTIHHHHFTTAAHLEATTKTSQPSKTSSNVTVTSMTSKKIPSTPPLPAALHRLGEIKHDLNLEASAVFVTTPDGSRTKFDSTGLTPRDFPPAGKMTSLDNNCNFSYFSVSEDPTGDADKTLTESGDDTPSFQSANVVKEQSSGNGGNSGGGAITTTTTTDNYEYEDEEEDVFFADEKAAIHRSFSDARGSNFFTKPSQKVNSNFGFKSQRQMSEAASSLLEEEQPKGLSSWDDTADLVHMSPNTTSVNKQTRNITSTTTDTPRDTITSECEVENS